VSTQTQMDKKINIKRQEKFTYSHSCEHHCSVCKLPLRGKITVIKGDWAAGQPIHFGFNISVQAEKYVATTPIILALFVQRRQLTDFRI